MNVTMIGFRENETKSLVLALIHLIESQSEIFPHFAYYDEEVCLETVTHEPFIDQVEQLARLIKALPLENAAPLFVEILSPEGFARLDHNGKVVTIRRFQDLLQETPAGDRVISFRLKDRVIYIPGHAEGDFRHPDCEHGSVSGVGGPPDTVFVKFDKQVERLGWDQTTSQSCRPEDLILEGGGT